MCGPTSMKMTIYHKWQKLYIHFEVALFPGRETDVGRGIFLRRSDLDYMLKLLP